MVAPGTHPRFQYELWPGWETIGLPLPPRHQFTFSKWKQQSETTAVLSPSCTSDGGPRAGVGPTGCLLVPWKTVQKPFTFSSPTLGLLLLFIRHSIFEVDHEGDGGPGRENSNSSHQKNGRGFFSASIMALVCESFYFIYKFMKALFVWWFLVLKLHESGILNVKYKNAGIQW